MAAGLGFKSFNTGDVLSAADTNGYLMQGIWVFASAAARDAAVTSPQEGNSCYLKDTDVIQVYSGSSWVVKSGGSSPLTTKGDLYTYSTTDARLAVGANGTTLVADSSTSTGLKWDTPAAGGGMTLISTTSLTGSSVTLSSISGTYVSLVLFISGVNVSTNCNFYCEINATTTTIGQGGTENGSVYFSTVAGLINLRGEINEMKSGNADSVFFLQIDNYASTTFNKTFEGRSRFLHPDASVRVLNYGGSILLPSTAISSLKFGLSAGTFSAGTILLYGVK